MMPPNVYKFYDYEPYFVSNSTTTAYITDTQHSGFW